MASKNPRIVIGGTVPNLGSRINVRLWWRPIALCCSIIGGNLMIFAAAIYISHVVVVNQA